MGFSIRSIVAASFVALAVVAPSSTVAQGHPQPCVQRTFEEARFTVCAFDSEKDELKLVVRDASGKAYRRLPKLARQAVLARWVEGLAEQADPQALAALGAACQQAETACAHARAQPARSGAVVSLRLAEDILAQARAALRPSGDALSAELAEADTGLAFARRHFNETAQVYNLAVSQFPTWLIAGLFGFRKAGTL